MPRLSFDEERGSTKAHSPLRHSRWAKHYYTVPRKLRLAIIIIAVLVLLLLARHQRDYTLKRWPTVFDSLIDNPPPGYDGHLWHAPHPVRQENGTHIDDRYIFMRKLGHGMEGSASLYADIANGDVVVVKTYRGIPRNPVPPELAPDFPDYASQWQVEIEAGLYFGQWNNGNETAFVPVRDYFVLQSGEKGWEWALVTPFIEDGTLETLAKSTKVHERTPQKLDKIFRPVFEKTLKSLKLMHDAGFCHDDIKPDNIFIADTKHWLLGDLGNVRHFGHPWHDTRRWKRENQWSDCVFNDIRRMFQTYMFFLRDSSGSQLDFDREFFLEEQSWSKLYWVWMRQPVEITETLELSEDYSKSNEPEWKPDWSERLTARYEACLKRKVEVEILPTTLHLGPWDYWPLRIC